MAIAAPSPNSRNSQIAATQLVNPAASAPQTAAAAPSGTTKYTFTGLSEALNAYEQRLIQSGTVEQANFYEVQFYPVGLGTSQLQIPGTTNYSETPMQNPNSAAAKILPDQNSMNTKGLTRDIIAGTQIVQYIETVMRSSTFITNQQKYIIDSVDGQIKPNQSANRTNQVDWFKINVQAVPINNLFDKKRNDYAYHITYFITPYGINQTKSSWFGEPTFRGVNKVYNYWFTGLNTQVLHYEQSFNNLWFQVLSGNVPSPATVQNYSGLATQLQMQNKSVPATRSAQNDQGATNGANNPASNLADFLYSSTDQNNVTIKIIGDPAWITQGEIVGLNASNFRFSGFYDDGTINTDAQQAVFVINWNSPADYDNGVSGPATGTGLVNVNASGTQNNNNNLSTAPTRQSAAYAAVSVKSTFSKGSFEQELAGVLLTNLSEQQLYGISGASVAEGRPANANPSTSASTDLRLPSVQDYSIFTGGQPLASATNPSVNNGDAQTPTPVNSPSQANPINNAQPQAAAAAGDPTSFGINLSPAATAGSFGTLTPPNSAAYTVAGAGGSPFGVSATVPTAQSSQLAVQLGEKILRSNTQVQVNTQTQIIAAGDDATGV